jgi:hypothetical protein
LRKRSKWVHYTCSSAGSSLPNALILFFQESIPVYARCSEELSFETKQGCFKEKKQVESGLQKGVDYNVN